jgi:hypothetical protein
VPEDAGENLPGYVSLWEVGAELAVAWKRAEVVYHDDCDGEQDPVAVSLSATEPRPFECEIYNNWGSLWIVCTGTCAIFAARNLLYAVEGLLSQVRLSVRDVVRSSAKHGGCGASDPCHHALEATPSYFIGAPQIVKRCSRWPFRN